MYMYIMILLYKCNSNKYELQLNLCHDLQLTAFEPIQCRRNVKVCLVNKCTVGHGWFSIITISWSTYDDT